MPLLFGWVLLRRVFREASWLALIPGAVVAGLVALMAAVNELRYFWEMRIAVWTAYKLLLALTLAIVVALPRRAPRLMLPGCASRPWNVCLLAAGALAVGVYFGIPAFNGYLNDAWWYHYPAAVQIQNVERFPLTHVFALDDPLYYHPGPDILAACASFLLDVPVATAWALLIVVLAPSTFLLAFALMARLARNYWSALLAAVLLVAGGNLRFLLFLTGKATGAAGALRVFNSQSVQSLLQLIFTPSHLLGVPLVLVLLLLFRHFNVRPSWRLGAALGLLLGSMTLVAEWYFLPLLAGLFVVAVRQAWRQRHQGTQNSRGLVVTLLPVVVAIAWGAFNNTYLSGLLDHFWMRSTGFAQTANLRLGELRLGEQFYQPKWTAPDLVPLRFNFSHFGQVPSWEGAASSQGSFIPILGTRFLMEAAPVLLLGIPFGLWLAWKRRTPLLLLLAWLAVVSLMPPILLDWGYRSTDFLRFFTGSYCFAALFFGWLVGDWMTRPSLRTRMVGGALAAAAVVSPIGLAVIGLMPGTLDTVKSVADTAQSLSQVTASPLESTADSARHRAFEKLAADAGTYLYPFTQGRDRAIVVVPADQVPKVKYFPEWMKMATYSRILLPVGWHWQDSLYSAYYRDAVTRLDARAIIALDAKWVIVSNVFQPELPADVSSALADRARFLPRANFTEGPFSLSIYKVRP